ncbi:MAG: hypothetical protein ACO2PO_22140 [Candidatus Calescibacterium sp.]
MTSLKVGIRGEERDLKRRRRMSIRKGRGRIARQSTFEIKNETSLIEKPSEIAISEDMLEFDIVIRMSPKKEWSVRLRVESIEKTKPHIVEPEGF